MILSKWISNRDGTGWGGGGGAIHGGMREDAIHGGG